MSNQLGQVDEQSGRKRFDGACAEDERRKMVPERRERRVAQRAHLVLGKHDAARAHAHKVDRKQFDDAGGGHVELGDDDVDLGRELRDCADAATLTADDKVKRTGARRAPDDDESRPSRSSSVYVWRHFYRATLRWSTAGVRPTIPGQFVTLSVNLSVSHTHGQANRCTKIAMTTKREVCCLAPPWSAVSSSSSFIRSNQLNKKTHTRSTREQEQDKKGTEK